MSRLVKVLVVTHATPVLDLALNGRSLSISRGVETEVPEEYVDLMRDANVHFVVVDKKHPAQLVASDVDPLAVPQGGGAVTGVEPETADAAVEAQATAQAEADDEASKAATAAAEKAADDAKVAAKKKAAGQTTAPAAKASAGAKAKADAKTAAAAKPGNEAKIEAAAGGAALVDGTGAAALKAKAAVEAETGKASDK